MSPYVVAHGWTRRKTFKGHVIVNLAQLANVIDSRQWIFVRDRVVHPQIIHNMSLATLRSYLKQCILVMACDREGRPYVSKPRKSK